MPSQTHHSCGRSIIEGGAYVMFVSQCVTYCLINQMMYAVGRPGKARKPQQRRLCIQALILLSIIK